MLESRLERRWGAVLTAGPALRCVEILPLRSERRSERCSEALNDFRSQAKLPRFNLPQKLMEATTLPCCHVETTNHWDFTSEILLAM